MGPTQQAKNLKVLKEGNVGRENISLPRFPSSYVPLAPPHGQLQRDRKPLTLKSKCETSLVAFHFAISAPLSPRPSRFP